MANWTDIPEADFAASQDIENAYVLEAKKTPPNPSRFRFERVNEATWKLTNGEMSNVPTRFGFWSGYRVTKAIAWVICLVPGKWLARCGARSCGPKSLKQAKANALAMAKGGAGDYRILKSCDALERSSCRLGGAGGRVNVGRDRTKPDAGGTGLRRCHSSVQLHHLNWSR